MVWLKIGISLILIRNLSDQLVNGLRGTVYDILPDGNILVEFDNIKEKVYINKVKFEVFDPRRNSVVAVREQIPLKPAYAITIHKSQGMTLDRVHVDCKDIFKPGQLGVALGRARTLYGLRVTNFNKKVCIKQTEKVLKFYAQVDSIQVTYDSSCCNGLVRHFTPKAGVFTVDDLKDISFEAKSINDGYPEMSDLEEVLVKSLLKLKVQSNVQMSTSLEI